MSNFDLTGGTPDAAAEVNTSAEGMVFDLSGVGDSAPSFEVMPKGTYNAVVEEMEFTTSQSSGNPMLHATYSIVDGEFDGRKVHDYYLLAGKGAEYSLPRLKQLLTRACPEVSLDSFNPQTFAEEGICINKACQLKLAVQTQRTGEYKGEKRNNVREILAASSASNSFLG